MFNVKTMIKIWLTYRRLKVNLLEHDNPSRTENVDAVADMTLYNQLCYYTQMHTLLQLSYVVTVIDDLLVIYY